MPCACGGATGRPPHPWRMGDVEAGTTLLRNLRQVRDMLRRGHAEDALAFLEWHVGE